MKTKHILKTAGLIAAFSFSSIFIVSCDSDSSSSSGNNSGSPADTNELQNGGVFEVANVIDSTIDGTEVDFAVFTITDLETRTLDVSD